MNEFCNAGWAVHRAEGRIVKAFSRASRQLAKTDKIDAKILADYGCKMQEQLEIYVPFKNALKAYIMRLANLKDMLQKEKNRLQAPNQDKAVLRSIKKVITCLEKEIILAEKQLDIEIRNDEGLSIKHEIIASQCGVGGKSAYVLLGLLPELGLVNRRKIAAIAGVAPYAKDSGSYAGHRFVRGGRKDVKKALFMCALSAARHDKDMKAFYEKLTTNGKTKMLAITAVMRKMITIINAKSNYFIY